MKTRIMGVLILGLSAVALWSASAEEAWSATTKKLKCADTRWDCDGDFARACRSVGGTHSGSGESGVCEYSHGVVFPQPQRRYPEPEEPALPHG